MHWLFTEKKVDFHKFRYTKINEQYKENTIIYLKTLFNTVEYCPKANIYPTREGKDIKPKKHNVYVISRGPKSSGTNLQKQ